MIFTGVLDCDTALGGECQKSGFVFRESGQRSRPCRDFSLVRFFWSSKEMNKKNLLLAKLQGNL